MHLNKPKFWDLKNQNLISYLLNPFTIFIKINNILIDLYPKKKIKGIKTICIGNIYIGGTGKTPATIKLYEISKKLNFNVCTGKKYYSAQKDEQILLDKKTNLICEKNRLDIIKNAINKKNDLIIFDDGLQDRNIKYDLNIVCFDAEKWIGNGKLIPSGPLREKLISLKKYDVVFIKNPDSNFEKIKKILKSENDKIKIYQTYHYPININKFDLNDKYFIFSGIGNPESFKKTLIKNNFRVIKEMIFPDHYIYKKDDIEKIKSEANRYNAKIITTEKDFVKIPELDRKDINFLEIDLRFDRENDLIDLIKTRLNEKY